MFLYYYNITIGEINTPTFEGHPVVVKVNSKTMDVDTFYLKTDLPSKIGFNKISTINNGLVIFGTIHSTRFGNWKIITITHRFKRKSNLAISNSVVKSHL